MRAFQVMKNELYSLLRKITCNYSVSYQKYSRLVCSLGTDKTSDYSFLECGYFCFAEITPRTPPRGFTASPVYRGIRCMWK